MLLCAEYTTQDDPIVSTMCYSHVDLLPAGAIQAVEDRVGEVVSMRLGRKPPGEFDEAGGDEGGDEVARG